MCSTRLFVLECRRFDSLSSSVSFLFLVPRLLVRSNASEASPVSPPSSACRRTRRRRPFHHRAGGDPSYGNHEHWRSGDPAVIPLEKGAVIILLADSAYTGSEPYRVGSLQSFASASDTGKIPFVDMPQGL